MQRTSILLLLLTLAAPLLAQSPAGQKSAEQPPALAALADEFMAAFFDFQPSAGTRAGLHQYDARMEDFSAARVARQIALYKDFERRFAALDTTGWAEWPRADREMMLAFVRSRIFELSPEGVPFWRINPDFYSSVASDSAFVLMGRNYATPEARLRALVAREQKLPALFAEAKKNLDNPPQVYTEVAIEQLPGIVSFFQNDAPPAFAGVGDAELQKEFQSSTAATVAALNDYLAWLKTELLPRSKGDYRLGAGRLSKKLLYEEMVDTPLDRLLAAAYENLHRNQHEYERVAKLIDPAKTPRQLQTSLEAEHPAADALLASFGQEMQNVRRFADAHAIIDTPGQSLPRIEETPAFMRALTSASMDAPGPFETQATEAFFNVTLPDASLTAAQREEFLSGFNHGVIVSTSIHEVIPGHYEQYLWNAQVRSRIRQFLSLDLSNIGSHFAGTNVEGWAHYTEQMIIDEGYGRTAGVAEEKDLPYLKLRLGQLQDALLRNARFVVAIEMHTGKMSFGQAVAFFEKEGRQTHPTAVMEARRGTSDPTYLMYTLGKVEILKLRADLEQREGKNFRLRDFHDELMRQGVAPWSLVRRALLGNSSAAL
jgi:uncharacterized protein (DUF885 family)